MASRTKFARLAVSTFYFFSEITNVELILDIFVEILDFTLNNLISNQSNL